MNSFFAVFSQHYSLDTLKSHVSRVRSSGRRNHIFSLSGTSSSCMASIVKCRNLSKNQLGGVIFGCTNNTKSECVTKKLFGLPAQHFSYVKNIEPGGSERTRYPAQVQIRVRLECQALSETLFKPTIVDNYYSQNHFLFELDHVQASKLISILTSLAFAPSVYTPKNSPKLLSAKQRFPLSIQRKETQAPEPPYFKDDFANSHDHFGTLGNSDDSLCLNGYNLLMEASLVNKNAEPEEKDLIHMKLKELARHRQHSAAAITGQSGEVTYMEDVDLEHETYENGMSTLGNRNNESPCHSLDSYATIAQLCQEMEELKAFKQEQTCKMGTLEKKLAEAELEIRRLRKVCMRFESVPETSMTIGASTGNETAVESPDLNELIFLVGGYDGVSWLKALHSFSPVNDVLKSLKPMSTLRSYASVAKLDEELFVFGGGDGSLLYDTVESYNPVNNQWTLRPSLNRKKGHLASATIHGKIFAVGGGNGAECFSDVEMFDSDVGRWISTRSMLQKRFALAAVELNGALYAVGGYDGIDYLTSAERFDPREHSWTRIESMSTRRGCHSLVAMNEKIYAIGGFDGIEMVPSVEIYDPRVGTWMTGDPMKQSRGYSAAAVLKESIYVIGGLRDNEVLLDTIERYREDVGWEITQKRSVGKRSFASAIVFHND
ncbi:uncharacterized protein [Primulina huaijiensis]|uniref:uncharacterized protein isoform X2 n=1 Tax=Primulina huaijiensis TaxID=1492673 RepID=UPI003CC75D04